MDPIVCKHKIPSDKRYVELLTNYLTNLLRLGGYNESTNTQVKDIVFAFKIALKRAIEFAYGDNTTSPLQVEFKVFSEKLEITIRDYGKSYNPSKNSSSTLDDYEEKGLALHVIEKTMDIVRYTAHHQKGGTLKLVKVLKHLKNG
ncbi:MAG: ATP-binding protein [Leptospirales bacterium]